MVVVFFKYLIQAAAISMFVSRLMLSAGRAGGKQNITTAVTCYTDNLLWWDRSTNRCFKMLTLIDMWTSRLARLASGTTLTSHMKSQRHKKLSIQQARMWYIMNKAKKRKRKIHYRIPPREKITWHTWSKSVHVK